MVVFKMRDSVPGPRYSPVCNVLRQWKSSLIPTYRVYQLYDIKLVNATALGLAYPAARGIGSANTHQIAYTYCFVGH